MISNHGKLTCILSKLFAVGRPILKSTVAMNLRGYAKVVIKIHWKNIALLNIILSIRSLRQRQLMHSLFLKTSCSIFQKGSWVYLFPSPHLSYDTWDRVFNLSRGSFDHWGCGNWPVQPPKNRTVSQILSISYNHLNIFKKL